MIDDDLPDNLKNAILEWNLGMAGKDLAVLCADEWENRQIIFEYNYPDPSLALLSRFGMPVEPGIKTAAVIQPGREFGIRFKDYRVELFGVRGRFRLGGRDQQPEGLFDLDESLFLGGLYGVFDFPLNADTMATMSLHGWRMRLFVRGIDTYVEQIWHTIEGRWFRFVFNMNCGHEPDIVTDSRNLKKLADGLELFNLVIEGLKKPPRKRVYTLEEFKADAYQAIERLAKAPDRRGKKNKRRVRRVLAKEALAEKIGCGKQTVYDFIEENPGLWEEFTKHFEQARNSASVTP